MKTLAYLDELTSVEPDVLAQTFMRINDAYRRSPSAGQFPKRLHPAMAALAVASVMLHEQVYGLRSPMTALACNEAAKTLEDDDPRTSALHARSVEIMLDHPNYKLDDFFQFSLGHAAFEAAFYFLEAGNTQRAGDYFFIGFGWAIERNADGNTYPVDIALDVFPRWLEAADHPEDAKRMRAHFRGGYERFWLWFVEQWIAGAIARPEKARAK